MTNVAPSFERPHADMHYKPQRKVEMQVPTLIQVVA